jgi:rRNA processing protein Krr1/Pno1
MHRNARKPPVSAWPAPVKSPTRLPPSQGVPLPAFEEPTVDADIQLISDGDGLAVIGNPTAVDLFLAAERLASKDLGLPRLGAVFKVGAEVAQVYPEIATMAGRWVQLTKESADLVGKLGLSRSSTSGLSTGVVKPSKGEGRIGEFIESAKAPVSQLSNPAVLSGAAGIMAQLAMQQTMDEITDYLATIDAKLDDVLRAQEDAVLADMIGVGFDIDEAMTLREHGGRVNEVTWSKVQGSSATIARTQAYALRQLDALAEKLERTTRVGDLAETAKAAESKAGDWLAVLARCFQLQDAIAVLELDRVLEVALDDLDGHRLGLKAVRQKRLDTISQCTQRLLARMDAAVGTANAKVLLNPIQSPAVVRGREHVAVAVADFHARLGIESGPQSLEARAWAAAATEFRDKVFETGAEGVDASMRLGSETLGRARSVTGKLSSGIAGRTLRWRGNDEGPAQGAE